MRKLVLSMGVSLDGLVARPGRHGAGGWGLPPDDPALKQRKLGWMSDVGLHLMGRKTYEEMSEFWPTSHDAYAAPMNEIPKVVFSRTLERVEWADSQIARGDLAQEIATLKRASRARICSPGAAPRSPNRSAVSGSSTSTALSCSPSHWGRGFPCSKISPHRCGSSSSTRRHTPPARRCTSTAPPLQPRDHRGDRRTDRQPGPTLVLTKSRHVVARRRAGRYGRGRMLTCISAEAFALLGASRRELTLIRRARTSSNSGVSLATRGAPAFRA